MDEGWYIAVVEDDGRIYLPQDLREYLEIVPGDVIDVAFLDDQGNKLDG